MKLNYKSHSLLKMYDIILYLMALSFILSSSSMYTVITDYYDAGITDSLFVIIFCVMGFIYWILLVSKKNKIKINALIFPLTVVAYFAIYLLFTGIAVMPCISRMVLPFTLLFMICEQEGSKLFLEKFFDKYSQIMSLIAIVSLVFYFLGTLGGMLPKSEIQYYNNRWTYSCYSYFNIYFENPLQNLSYAPRNVGVFMEAPAFAIALIYALFWNLIKEKKNKFIIVILLVTMVTTLSTTAFIVGGLLISLYYYFNAKNRSIKIALRAFTPLLVVLAAWMIYLIMKAKMTTGNYGSVLIRLDDVGAAWKSFLQAPIFGAGFYNLEAIYSNFTYNTLKGDPTFGFINILAYGGIYLGLYYYGGLLWFVKSNILDKNGKILFVFMMSALLCSSPMQYSIMLYLFISAGYVAKLSSAKMNKNCHVNKEYNLSKGENG